MKPLPPDPGTEKIVNAFRQTEPTSIIGYHETPPVTIGVVIEMEQRPLFELSSVDQSSLSSLVTEKNLNKLKRLGGVEGIGKSLKTDLLQGIKGDDQDVSRRTETFGANTYCQPPTKSFFYFVGEVFRHRLILILLACAIIPIVLGIDFSGLEQGLREGGSIMILAFFVVAISAFSDFKESREWDEVSNISNNISGKVLRNGISKQVSIFQIVVGDIICLRIGDHVPADGLFVQGNSLQVDESSITGESNVVEIGENQSPFLLSGTHVANGHAKMLVTAVGMNTEWGRLMARISHESNTQTLFRRQLKDLASLIAKINLGMTSLVLVSLLVYYFTGHTKDEKGNREFLGSKTKVCYLIVAQMQMIALCMTIVMAANLGLLPLAITLTSARKRMMGDKAIIVRNLSVCETMGSTATLCTDIPGTFSSNKMKVSKVFVGTESMKGKSYTSITPKVLELFAQGISLTRDSAQKLFTVTEVDEGIYSWAVMEQNIEILSTKELSILDVDASCHENKRIGISVKIGQSEMINVFWRGDAERILSSSSRYFDAFGNCILLGEQERASLYKIMEDMAAEGLLCIAFAHKQLSEDGYKADKANGKITDEGLVLLGYLGLKILNPSEVNEAVRNFQRAGVNVKLVTSYSVSLAKVVGIGCGILGPNEEGSVMKGEEFVKYTEEERMVRVDQIKVLAKSSSHDKLLLVQCLRKKGHVVAMVGNDTHDVAALKEADIGITMGIQRIEVVKQNSDIVILDGRFSTLVKALRCGRSAYANIQKIIQFYLTINVAAVSIILMAAVSTGKTPISASRILWLYLMAILGGVALATENPHEELISKDPSQYATLITNTMRRDIICQVIYQITMIMLIIFGGKYVFNSHKSVIETLVFTTSVFLQVFNMFNVRRLEEKNVFGGILENKLFLVLVAIIICFQVGFVKFQDEFAFAKGLDWKAWGVCIGIGVGSLPLGWLVKFIPVPNS